jgi:hypothetical protein
MPARACCVLLVAMVGMGASLASAATDEGTVSGQIWRGEPQKRQPVARARVQIRDPVDGRTWTTTTDANGRYEIRKAPLGARPFEISAERDGLRSDDSYQAPKGAAVLEKNLFLGPHLYRVTVQLKVTAPFVADGRMTLSELGFKVVFENVKPMFEPDGNPFWGCCHLENLGGKGAITQLVFNDVQPSNDARHRPWITQGPPKQFTGMLSVADDGAALKRRAQGLATERTPEPPDEVKLGFRTEFWLTPLEWQSRAGERALADYRLEFKSPWRSLLAGKAFTTRVPLEPSALGESGTWTIWFEPQSQREK